MVVLKILNGSDRIVCIRVHWNHPDLSGCAPRVWGAGSCFSVDIFVIRIQPIAK
jgi:hypothetical protein